MKETVTHKMVNRLHRRNSSASSTASVDYTSGERFEFKFSALHALQVPKGWDKLSLSLISVETGKAIAKTGRSLVQNGNCQWTENLSVYIWVPHDDASKGHGQSLHKLLISMGSGRSGILGEVTVNLSSHLSSETSTTVAEPLKNCSYGTILQMEIQCLTPRANTRNDRWTDTDSFVEDANASDDLDTTSDVSDGRTTKSVESSMSSNFMYTSQAGGPGSKDASVSARGSLSSIDSMDDSFGRNIIEVANDLIARHDSISSSNRAQYSSYHVSESPRLSQKQDSGKFSHSIPASPLRTFGSPEFVLEGEGATVEELRAEARMWERNARRLKVDLDFSKKEFKDQTRKLQNASMEIIALQTECDGLKHENDYLKAILDESEVKEKAAESLKLQTQDDIQSELEEEIKFQRDLNNNLSLQFNKTQESNLELVSVLQELEETIEKQRMEIESLNALKDKIKELERDCNDLTNENLELVFKLKESKNDLATSVDSTEVSEITKLECEIQKLKEEANKRELDRIDVGNLQNRCNDLESKCVKLEVDIQGFKDKAYYLDGELNKYRAKAEEHENEVVRLKELLKLQEEDKHEKVYSFTAIETKPTIKDHFSVENEMEFSLKDDTGILEKPNMELSAKSSEIEVLKSDCLLKDQEIQRLNAYQTDLEIQLSDLKIIKKQLMGGLKAMQTESTIISECLDKVKNDMVVLNDTKDSQVAANKTLEKKLRELESCNKELEQQAEIKQLEAELETSKVDMRQKLEDMQKRWLEAQEECEYLKKANPKLQTTAENLIEECSQLQVSNRELKQQRLDLHNRCTDLEAERRESQYNFSKLSTKLEDLEDKFSLMMNKIAAKEKIFDSELEALHLKIEERMEKLVIGEDITDDKIIKTIEVEYEENIHDLMVELVAYKQNNAVLEVKLEKLTELLEKTRSSEENLRVKVGGLEGDLKHCEYQRVQLTEEISSLTGQLQKIPLLQDELVALKKSYNDVKYENERLEASLQLVTGDYKELKEEKTSLLQRTLSMQKAMIELEEYKLSKAALEEQVIRLRGDLTAREALCAQDTELKNEIGRLKRSNSQLRWKINSLQEEKDECLKNAQVLEEKLEQIEYSTNNSVKSFRSDSNISFHEHMKLTEDVGANIDEVTIDASSRIRSLENELAEALQANDMYKAKINSFLSKEQIHESDVPLELDVDVNTVKKEHDKDASLLETELKELRERYLHMSLKYAEVEAQREELVSKLKAVKPGKSWFS
ncbi:putative NT-type C2 domain-containing protein [Helianthus annuus]|nr:putative NT-type C2 domain-containing protein [Helianthus annuus]